MNKTTYNTPFVWGIGLIVVAVLVIGLFILLKPQATTPDTGSTGEDIIEPDMVIEVPQQPAPSELADLIRVTTPQEGAEIKSPLNVTGEARGTWYFEADFPVELLDTDGVVVAQGIAQAQSDPLSPDGSSEASWMTEDFVPFAVTLNFNESTTTGGMLVLKKSNPSGLPEHDSELRIPVIFTPATRATTEPSMPSATAVARDGCIISGCSSQLCGEEEQVSTCEYRAIYACYESATCERQANEACGWTPSVELLECLNNSAR